MERSSKIIAVAALCVAVVGLTLGFAAFSNTLTIESSANVKPDASTFNVDFSSSNSALENNPVAPVLEPGTLNAGSATISNVGNPTISGLEVEFTEPGQKATLMHF